MVGHVTITASGESATASVVDTTEKTITTTSLTVAHKSTIADMV